MAAVVEETLFQGKPSLTLKWREDSKYPFSFGLNNARLIVACMAEIQQFVKNHPQEARPPQSVSPKAQGEHNNIPNLKTETNGGSSGPPC